MNRLRAVLVIVLAVGVLGFGLYSGVRSRRVADTELRRATADAAVEVVRVVSPVLTEPTQEIRLPGTTQAFTDASLFARTNG